MSAKMVDSIISESFRIANISDLDFLVRLENECFEEHKRSSKQSIRRSINSNNQLVILIENKDKDLCGSIFIRPYKKHINITSLGVLESERGKGYGNELLRKAIEYCELLMMNSVTLEVDINDSQLIRWYESFGFEQIKVLEDYYGVKKHATMMELKLFKQSQYLVVTDYDTDFFDSIENVKHIKATEYIDSIFYQKMKGFSVFNFCTNYKYQSVGYYISLLALARNHSAYPSAGLLRDVGNKKVIKSIGEEISELIQKALIDYDTNELIVRSYFGVASELKLQKLIDAMSNLYHAPIVEYCFVKKNEWHLDKLKFLSLKDVKAIDIETLMSYAQKFFLDKRFVKSSLKRYEYDMAILIDTTEKIPPSDQKALQKFEEAAERIGFYVEYITKKDYSRIPEFDALFIRATTNVNDYTYDFARYAYAEGLVVIDDPWSILRCANKMYLNEALSNAKVKMPMSWVLNRRSDYKNKIKDFKYPIILKLPDSAFSAGVYKVNNVSECNLKLKIMFKSSELIVAQEFMPTDYDWRIGVLDGQILYACKYYMAKDHWQIVSWDKEGKGYREGDYEAINIADVPHKIVTNALKATAAIGDGLYGVDLKTRGNEVYVIEVNDNPSIEHMVEDTIEGNALYNKIMMLFYKRLENNTKTLRSIN